MPETACEMMVAHAAPATPHFKARDKPDIQTNVHAACHEQENERHDGIAEAAQNAGNNVVICAAENTEEIDDEIITRHGVNILRCL